jgi:hypothetical protein
MDDDLSELDEEPEDVLAKIRAEVEQHKMEAREFMPAIAAEFLSLVDSGVPIYSAAVIIGTRWKYGS